MSLRSISGRCGTRTYDTHRARVLFPAGRVVFAGHEFVKHAYYRQRVSLAIEDAAARDRTRWHGGLPPKHTSPSLVRRVSDDLIDLNQKLLLALRRLGERRGAISVLRRPPIVG